MLRFIFNIGIFLSIFLLNWWALLIILIIGILMFERFYEGLLYTLIFDFIYMAEKPDHFYLYFLVSVIFVLLLLLIEKSKKYLRFYPDNV